MTVPVRDLRRLADTIEQLDATAAYEFLVSLAPHLEAIRARQST